jgi:phospholipid-binding lipoprotein MlaA
LRPGPLFVVCGLGLALAASGAAAAQTPSPDDPYEGFNRRVYEGSMGADTRIFLPVAKVYHALTPGLIGLAIHNVLVNLSEPLVIANDILQGRFKMAGRDTLRLTANSLAGFGGIMDVAGKAGLTHHDNDFGVTLGTWGVPPGPYLFLPLIGPTTVRDAIGFGVDGVADPLNFVRFPGRLTLRISSQVVGTLDTRIRSQGDMDALLSGAADPYATLRSVYLQQREAEVRGDSAPVILPPIDDPEPAPAAPAVAPAPSPSADLHAATPSPLAMEQTGLTDPDRPIATARPFDRDGATQLAALD